jgi:cytochrome c oxidase subunit II
MKDRKLERSDQMQMRGRKNSKPLSVLQMFFVVFWSIAAAAATDPTAPLMSPTNIFAPASTPAKSIFGLSLFVLAVTGAIFVVVFTLLAYAVVKFRKRARDDGREPPQVYGSNQVELAWTVIPVLIVVALFMATARVIATVQKVSAPSNAIAVTAIGHQFWWEYRYPGLGVVTANELHVPVSDPVHPTPTFIKLLSADTDHSFWVPRLAGKTDLIPNHPNSMWIDPQETGLYLGQCAQYCGTQHAKMLLRVYVQSRDEFERWIQQQRQPAFVNDAVSQGQRIFETTACINCHTVSGTVANGRFGPDLTHLMSRDTIAAGAAPNTPENLRLWIRDPNTIKPGSLMPAMELNEPELDAVTAYLETLR